MGVDTFVDTNILIYAYDLDAGRKRDAARFLLAEFWKAEGGMISTQVLQEFYVNVTWKIAKPLAPAKARGIIQTYMAWQVELITMETILFASELQERHNLSFWDAMILAAANNGGAAILLTEDLNHGQLIEGIEIKNPFKDLS